MQSFGLLWVVLGISRYFLGSAWSWIVVGGFDLSWVVVDGFGWFLVVVGGFHWFWVVTYCFSWYCAVVCGFRWFCFIMGVFGLFWVFLISFGWLRLLQLTLPSLIISLDFVNYLKQRSAEFLKYICKNILVT